ncbi:MAG: trypsin-like serine protease, partial [Verrucomicrobiaceae bacterium]|nr:trypsin-like serine protease [Verrucomicrobiaceae bacterium]
MPLSGSHFPLRAATVLVALKIITACAFAAGGQESKAAPKTDIATLLRIQADVQKLLPQVRPALVAIQAGGGTASGVIISPTGLILTAAHVVGKPGRDVRVVLEDGTVTSAKSLGLDQ